MGRFARVPVEIDIRREWLTVRPGRLPSVQILRAIAALLVVLGHCLYEVRAFDPEHTYDAILNTQYWTAGVDLFFVLSGFIMMWTFGGRFGEPSAWLDFLKRRLVRIVPLYWIFTGLMVVATLAFADRLETAVFTPGHALLSFLFIPHIAPQGGIHPILAPGWTLTYEMFFYACFALALCIQRPLGLLVLFLLFLTGHAVSIYTDLLPAALSLFWGDAVMFEFLLGIGFYFVQSDGSLSSTRLVWVLLFCLVAAVVALLAGVWGESRLYHFGLPALAAFAVMFYLFPVIESRLLAVLVLIGEASYALYLSHPFLLELTKIPLETLGLPAEAMIPMYIALSVAAAVAFSLVFYAVLERPLTSKLTTRIAGAGAKRSCENSLGEGPRRIL